jgi:hypothetical protein
MAAASPIMDPPPTHPPTQTNKQTQNFVSKFEAKLNQLKLAVIAALVAKVRRTNKHSHNQKKKHTHRMETHNRGVPSNNTNPTTLHHTISQPPHLAQAIAANDPAGARAFLEALAEKRERLGPEASLYVDMEIALLKIKQVRGRVAGHVCVLGLIDQSLRSPLPRSLLYLPFPTPPHCNATQFNATQRNSKGDVTEVEATLKSGKAVLDGLAGAEEAIVYSNYYKAASEYYKVGDGRCDLLCDVSVGRGGLGVGEGLGVSSVECSLPLSLLAHLTNQPTKLTNQTHTCHHRLSQIKTGGGPPARVLQGGALLSGLYAR